MIGTLESALKLVPGAKHVYVVSGVSSLDKMLQNQARQDFTKWEAQLDFRYLSDMSFEQMLSEVSSAPPDTIVLFISLIADITGKAYNARGAVQQMSQVSRAPIFGVYDVLLGYGIAGGFLVDGQYIGTKAGELALKLLTGGLSRDKTTTSLDVPPVPEFDWRQLRHWNLSADALPKGSIVINRELTLWDFKYYVYRGRGFRSGGNCPDHFLHGPEAPEACRGGGASTEDGRAGSILQHFPGSFVYRQHRRLFPALELCLGKDFRLYA